MRRTRKMTDVSVTARLGRPPSPFASTTPCASNRQRELHDRSTINLVYSHEVNLEYSTKCRTQVLLASPPDTR